MLNAWVLAIDTETSGLPNPLVEKGSEQYPWPVQIGAVLFHPAQRRQHVLGTLVRAEGRQIQLGATGVHGITTRRAAAEGITEVAAIGVLCHFAAQASFVTGFQLDFDLDVIESSLIRMKRSTRMLIRPGLQKVDLIRPASQLCKIPSEHESGAYRWPKLEVALHSILDEDMAEGDGHDALRDADAARRLFLRMLELGALDPAEMIPPAQIPSPTVAP